MDAATWIAIAAALFGGAGVKVIERWLNRGELKDDSALKLRTELRQELERLRKELDDTREELDLSREKYWQVVQQFNTARIELDNALNKIQQQAISAQQALPITED